MISKEQKVQLGEIFEELNHQLELTPTQMKSIERSYKSVGEWLAREESTLFKYNPEIKPQGSIRSGTAIQSVNENDDIDVDLVCTFHSKHIDWSQSDLKEIVKKELELYIKQFGSEVKEKRRCLTIPYNENASSKQKYHMDILPSIITEDCKIVMESFMKSKTFSLSDVSKLAISITDNKSDNYYTEKNHTDWPNSNPFGFSDWFLDKAEISITKTFSRIDESVEPIPAHKKTYPLQRVVQLLKRHRDIMFEGDEDKPISIIITTLAGLAYNKEDNIFDAFVGVVNRFETGIKTSSNGGDYVIPNPVNLLENFADKWIETPRKKDNFFKWLKAIKSLVANLEESSNNSHDDIISKSFGTTTYTKALIEMGNRYKSKTASGSNTYSRSLGLVSSASNVIKPHNFFGNA